MMRETKETMLELPSARLCEIVDGDCMIQIRLREHYPYLCIWQNRGTPEQEYFEINLAPIAFPFGESVWRIEAERLATARRRAFDIGHRLKDDFRCSKEKLTKAWRACNILKARSVNAESQLAAWRKRPLLNIQTIGDAR